MKKTISIIATLILMFSLSTSAFASDEILSTEEQNNEQTITEEESTQSTTEDTAESIVEIILNEITSAASRSDETYEISETDKNALLIDTSETVEINNPTVLKTGDSNNGEDCNFYGLNSAVLVKGGTNTSISGGEITSDASGGNGLFCYGSGTNVTISNTKIRTSKDNSGGIMTAGGGTTNANNLNIETSGKSSAAIRTDRGGGKVVVSGGDYTSNGLGSPAIYSTADITVEDANLTSNISEGVCIEGKNSITLKNCSLVANNTKTNSHARFLDTIMLYQSMSGDASKGKSKFTMSDGTLTNKSGHVFHVTNTNAVITLSNVDIKNKDKENILFSVCDDGWSGAENKATLITNSQFLYGGILVGDNSSLNINLKEGSVFEGYIDGNIKDASGKTVSTETGNVTLTLEGGKVVLTKDTYVSTFIGSTADVTFNGYTLYVDGVALDEKSEEIFTEEPAQEEDDKVIESIEEDDEEETTVTEEATTRVSSENVKRDIILISIIAAIFLCALIIIITIIKNRNDTIKDEKDSLEDEDEFLKE